MIGLPNYSSPKLTARWKPSDIILGDDEVSIHRPKLDPVNYIGALRDRLTVRNTVILDVDPFPAKPTFNLHTKIARELEKQIASFNIPMSRYCLVKATAPFPQPRSSALIIFPCSYPITIVPILVSLARSVQDVLGMGLDIITVIEVPSCILLDSNGSKLKCGSVSYVKLCILTNLLRANGLPIIHMKSAGEKTDIHTLVSYIAHFQPVALFFGYPSASTEWNYRTIHGFMPSVFSWITCVAIKDGFEGCSYVLDLESGINVRSRDSGEELTNINISSGNNGIKKDNLGDKSFQFSSDMQIFSSHSAATYSVQEHPKSLASMWNDDSILNQRQEQGIMKNLIGTQDVKDISLFLIKKFRFLKESILERMAYSLNTSSKHISVLEHQIYRPSAPPFPVSQLDQLPPFGPFILHLKPSSQLSAIPLKETIIKPVNVLANFLKYSSDKNKRTKNVKDIKNTIKNNKKDAEKEGIKLENSLGNENKILDESALLHKAIQMGLVPLHSLQSYLSAEDIDEERRQNLFRDRTSYVCGGIPHITNMYFAIPYLDGLDRPTVLIEAVGKYSELVQRRGVHSLLTFLPTVPIDLKEQLQIATTEREMTSILNTLLLSCLDFPGPHRTHYKPSPLKEFIEVWECVVIMLTGRTPRELHVNPHKGRPTYWGVLPSSCWDDAGGHLWACLSGLRKMMVEFVNVAEEIYIRKHERKI